MNGKRIGSYQFINQAIDIIAKIIDLFRYYLILEILERCVIFNQLYNFLNENSLLSKHQFGFRPKSSTLTAPIQTCDEFYQNLDNSKLNGVVF